MQREPPSTPEKLPNGFNPDRNRLEIIRFASAEARRQAIRALIDCGMLNFTSYRDEEWLVNPSVARKLRERAVPFEWLTENA